MFNFRKIATVLSSTLMVGSTVALAAAANYPAPFIQGGNANVAVVWGGADKALATDLLAASDITVNLQAALAAQTATGGGAGTSTAGETYALFGSTELYINDTINAQRTTITDGELPIILADTSFSGNVDADLTHTIKMGNVPRFKYSQQPTSDDDPVLNLELSTTSTDNLYNATISFDKATNFSHTDSEGESLTMFGQEFTVGSATDATDLILFRASEKAFLDSVSNPSQDITIDGSTFTVELVGATDTSATIKLTDSTGASNQKEINEAASKKILGIEVSVNIADESTALNQISAEVIVGASKLKLTDGNEVLFGSDEDPIEGTKVTLTGGTDAITQLTIQVAAPEDDKDAVLAGEEFVDPVFGSFKFSLAGFANDDDREEFSVQNSGDDKMTLTMATNQGGDAKTIHWVYNATTILAPDRAYTGIPILADSGGDIFVLTEMGQVNKSMYTVVGNEDEGRLVEVSKITNGSSGFDSDAVSLKDAFTGETYDVSITAEGTGTVSIAGNSYTVNYYASPNTLSEKARYVRINDPSSSGNNMNVFNTIQTSKGANIAFYQPTAFNLTAWDGTNALAGIRFPDGDGYTQFTVVYGADGGNDDDSTANYTINSVMVNDTSLSTTLSVGQVRWTASRNVSGVSILPTLQLNRTDDATLVTGQPALIMFEEQDDNTVYEANIILLEGVGSSADGLGVTAVIKSSNDLGGYGPTATITHESDTDIKSDATLWGTIITIDASESDQQTVTISYPGDQIYGLAYMGEVASSVTAGTSGGGSVKALGTPIFGDSESSAYAGKNLIVVGGSCVNTEAASLLGSTTPLCSADWEAKTGVGSGSFLIETFARGTGQVATLVGGHGAGDTTNAATFLTTQTVDTTVGMKYIGTSGTSATLQTTATT